MKNAIETNYKLQMGKDVEHKARTKEDLAKNLFATDEDFVDDNEEVKSESSVCTVSEQFFI